LFYQKLSENLTKFTPSQPTLVIGVEKPTGETHFFTSIHLLYPVGYHLTGPF